MNITEKLSYTIAGGTLTLLASQTTKEDVRFVGIEAIYEHSDIPLVYTGSWCTLIDGPTPSFYGSAKMRATTVWCPQTLTFEFRRKDVIMFVATLALQKRSDHKGLEAKIAEHEKATQELRAQLDAANGKIAVLEKERNEAIATLREGTTMHLAARVEIAQLESIVDAERQARRDAITECTHLKQVVAKQDAQLKAVAAAIAPTPTATKQDAQLNAPSTQPSCWCHSSI